MSKLAAPPTPSSSSTTSMHEEAADASDQPNGSRAPPPEGSSSGGSPSDSNGAFNPPPSPSPPPPSPGNTPPSHSSPPPPPPPSPSHSSSNGGGSSSSPPAPPSQPSDGNSSGNSGGSSPSSPPPNQSSPPQQPGGSNSTPSPPSPSPPSPSSPEAPMTPSASTPPSPPQWSSNDGQSSSNPPAGGQSPPSPAPPPPANQPVVFIPIPVSSTTPPGALAPPGQAAVAPAASIMSTRFPGSMPAAAATQGANNASTAGGEQHSPQEPSRAVGAGSTVAAAIAGAAVVSLVFAMVAAFLVLSRRRRKKKTDGLVESGAMYPPPAATAGATDYYGQYESGMTEAAAGKTASFSYEEVTSMTSNFSRDNVIGEGGFGRVYKGWLAGGGGGRCVAVKQLKDGSGQGEREFQAEVEIISRVHHRHLVSLVGYCASRHHRVLVYDFVPNGTLEHHLHGRGMPVMDWPTRLRIAIGAAKGLAYLHEDCHPRIIHRDIKSANILLDYSFEAQVADFGLAKLTNDSHTHVSTRILGTFGYLAPEYALSGKLTDRSDVFSFGVVLLELITGRKPVDATRPLGEESLVEWARPTLAEAVETGELDGLVDARLEEAGGYNRVEMGRMVEAAAACVRHSAPRRPRMVQVMRALDEEGDLSNGVKVGQSQALQEAAIQQLRRTAFASEEFTDEYSETHPINGAHSR